MNDNNKMILFNSNINEAYLIKQYEIYITSALEVSERREKANSFFVSLNTVLLSVTGLVFSTIQDIDKFWLIFMSMTGLFLCYYWAQLINNYRQLNSGKFKVIHEIEQKMALRLFSYEWIILGEGKDPKIYKSLTSIEGNIPILFSLLYSLISIYLLMTLV